MKVDNAKMKSFTDGTMTHVPLARIVVDNETIPQRRLDQAHVDELSASIETSGLDVPLIVWNGGGDKGKLVQLESGEKVPASYLVAGQHRRAALKALHKRNVARFKELFPDGVPVVVQGGELKDILTAQLRENVMRKDMAPEQVLPALERLIKKDSKGGMGMSQSEVAKAIGKSKGWVSQIIAIRDELGDEGVEALKSGDAGLADAREAAAEVRKAKKAGKPTDAKAALKKVVDKKKKAKAAGRERAERRLSAKVLWKRYLAIGKLTMGDAKSTLESALGYLAGDENVELDSRLTEEDNDDKGEDSEE